MIEQLKQRPKTINQENLSHVNSWWDKILIKNSQKIEKQLSKFKNDKLLLNTKNFNKNSINYDDYLTFSNKILEFWIQKEKKVVQEMKVVQKFSKMISAFGEEAGILANIQAIDKYFETINHQDIAEKKLVAIEIGNKVILQMYNAYKNLIVKIIDQDPQIKNKLEAFFATDVIPDKELFNVMPSLKVLFKFVNLAFRSNKISKAEFSEIYFNTLFINSYIARFVNLYDRFVMQIK